MLRDQLKNKGFKVRANLKAKAITDAILADAPIGRLEKVSRTRRKDIEVEIININKIEGGVEVFARAWKNGKQVGFGTDGSIDIERFRVFNPPTLVEDPLGEIQIIRELELATRTISRIVRFREDPKEALLQSVTQTISSIAKFGDENIVPGKVGNTTSTFYPSLDGYVRYNSTGVSWASIIAAAGNQTNTAATNLAWQVSGAVSGTGASSLFDVLARYVLVFDTSSIPDGDTISSATFSGYCDTKTDEFSVDPTMTIMGATLASDASIANGDYASTFTNHQVSFATAKTFADFTTSAYNDFALNASGISAISKTGNSRFSLRFAQDVTGGTTPQQATAAREFFVSIASSEASGTSQDPKLVVEHAGAAAAFRPRVIIC